MLVAPKSSSPGYYCLSRNKDTMVSGAVWKERNKRKFDGIEQGIDKLRERWFQTPFVFWL